MGEAGFVLDLGRCVGCAACVLACRLENADRASSALRRVLPLNEARRPGGPTWFLSLACHHCERPACARACPSGAYERRADGVVLHHDELCLGCRYCEMACPFGAPQFDAATGVMAKCDFCHARVAEGRAPACVAACPTEALRTGSGLDSPVAQLRDAFAAGELSAGPIVPDPAGCRPAIHFKPPRGIRGQRLQHLMNAQAGLKPGSAAPDQLEHEQDLTPASIRQDFIHALATFHEWPLVLFTAFAIPAAGVFAARLFAEPASGPTPAWDGAHTVAAAALFAGLLCSLAHLGRPLRAPLALRRAGRNALSTEVALASALLIVASLALLSSVSAALRVVLTRAAGVLALGLLAALGLVYFGVRARWPWRTPLVFTPVMSGLAAGAMVMASTGAWPSGVALGLLSLDVLAVLATWLHPCPSHRAPVHPGIFARHRPLLALRLCLVDVVPSALLLAHLATPAVVVVMAGLFVDRFAFYGLTMTASTEAELAHVERRFSSRR